MSEPKGTLAPAYVVTAGRVEATVDLVRQSVRFILRDQVGLERGSVEMFIAEWSAMADAIAAVADVLAKKAGMDTAGQGELPLEEAE